MCFILFSLVVRTAYQGRMFEFLQKEIRKPTIKTIDELIQHDYKLFVKKTFKTYYADFEVAQRWV